MNLHIILFKYICIEKKDFSYFRVFIVLKVLEKIFFFFNKVFLQSIRLSKCRQSFKSRYLFDRRWLEQPNFVTECFIIQNNTIFRTKWYQTSSQIACDLELFDFNFENLFGFVIQCAAMIHIFYKLYCATYWYIQIYTVLVDPAHFFFQ